ncbi:hypothetical protein PaecuDRAFT_0834 [Paenibacillus curdlanolyticus YK9]|uniref:Butirosin biosynthesis protein H N-terminal domain-containing protein n=1 Tax=Paenibacillus curdlanolyticus YK9 TaxID=717606 RepID=E0I5B2_9BACL|nr:hypothetical protein [Paenibacillus curdlanolyticus]EFM12154.1 hypothetical protein PaecuDRAFT_0834 [Paenibacillus curdlanolyticus YK9]
MIETQELTVDIPSYVYCLIPYIHAKLKSEGSASAISLLSNLDLAGLPAYTRGESFDSARIDFHIKDIHGFERSTNILKLDMHEHKHDTFEAGLASISQTLAEGKAVVLSGTTYCLPYSSEYYNPSFIETFGYGVNATMYIVGDHWFSVYGIDETGVRIYDPIPNKFTGTIPLEDFRHAWGGNALVPELADKKDVEKCTIYGQLDIHVGHIFSQAELNDLFLRTANTITTLYLKGESFNLGEERCWFGHAAVTTFMHDLEQFAGQAIPAERIEGCLYFMRVNRLQMGVLLTDMRELALIPQDIMDAYLPLQRKWETIYNSFVINVARKRADVVERTIAFLKEALDLEMHLFMRLQLHLNGTPLLDRAPAIGAAD